MGSAIPRRVPLPRALNRIKSFALPSLRARQSDSGSERGFGGSNGAIALYVIFGIVVLAVIFTSVFRSHRGRGPFSARSRPNVHHNQPTPWNPSSFSHHRGMSQSSGGDVAYNNSQSQGARLGQGSTWASRAMTRLAPRGRAYDGDGVSNTSNRPLSYHSEWPSSRPNIAGDTLPFSERSRWTTDARNVHVAVPPAYHKIVADKPPAFHGAPPEYYEEIDLEAQRTGQTDVHGSSSGGPSAVTGTARSEQSQSHQLSRENQSPQNSRALSFSGPESEGRGDPAATNRK